MTYLIFIFCKGKHLYSRLAGRTEFIQLSAVAVQGVTFLLSIARTAMILRLLGAENYGLVGLASAAGGMFAVLQHFGLGVGAAKEASLAQNTRQLGVVTVALLSVRFALALPLFLFLFLVGAPMAASAYNQPVLLATIRLYAVYLVVSAPGDILGAVLTGTERYRAFFALRILNEVVMTVAMMWMVSVKGIYGYFVGYIITGTIYSIASGIKVWQVVGLHFVWPSSGEVRRLVRSTFRTSMAVFAAKLMRSFSGQIPFLIAGFFLTTVALGWLRFAQQAGGYLMTAVSPVLIVTLPRMMRLQADQGSITLSRYFSDNFRRIAWGVSLLLLPALMFSREISWLLGGSQFVDSWHAVQLILMVSACTVLADNIFAGIHLPLDRELAYVMAYCTLFIATVMCTIILARLSRTADSTALAMALGAVTLLGVSIGQVRRLSGLSASLLKSCVTVAVATFFGFSGSLMATLIWRLVMFVVGISLLCLQLWRTDPVVRQIVATGVLNMRLGNAREQS